MRKINWPTIFLELLVVFFGVYGAFILDRYQQDRAEMRNKITYFETFTMQLNGLESRTQATLEQIDKELQRAASEGQAYEPRYLSRLIHFKNNLYLLEAAFLNESFVEVGPKFLRNLEQGGNLIRIIEEEIRITEQELRHYTIKENQYDAAAFINWYTGQLQELKNLLNNLQRVIQTQASPGTQETLQAIKQKAGLQ